MSWEHNDNPIQTCVGPIYEFKPVMDNVPHAPSIGLFGKRRTGKSTSGLNLMPHYFKEIPRVVVMSNTAFTGSWEAYVPKKQIVQGLRMDVLDYIINTQKRLVKKYGETDPKVQMLLIMDDIIADQIALRYTADIISFFVEGRHLGIAIMIMSQNVKGVPPLIRRNLDITIMQPISNKHELEAIWELSTSSFMNKKEWHQFKKEVVKTELLEGHTVREPNKTVRVMVIADSVNTDNISEKVFHWTPVHSSKLPPFRLGHPRYWEHNEDPSKSMISEWGELAPKREPAKSLCEVLDEVAEVYE